MNCTPKVRQKTFGVQFKSNRHGLIRNFISGFATGIDLIASQTVQSLKLSHPLMVLTAAIPFRGQAGRFKPHDRRCYDELIEKADEVILLS